MDSLTKRTFLTPERRYELLAIPDVRSACDLLKPVFDTSQGDADFVSLEVSPRLANDEVATVAAAHRLHAEVGRENLLIKIPATEAGLRAIRAFSLPNFREGFLMHERNGTYYLSYSADDTRSENYHVDYATGPSPLGPWTYRGTLLQKDTSIGVKGTGHHSIVQQPGTDNWYIVYHRFAVPLGDGTNREMAIDKLVHNGDGSLQRVGLPLSASIPPPADSHRNRRTRHIGAATAPAAGGASGNQADAISATN
ncbi:family 43 glycosylhydrolase [Niveibacterium sp. SC-1]|uniref:family 43 glycosylhydrolase n=1 Tax=Niveibacterium sp. SC-1 TaxID=3135646 RepID=UPI00311F5BBB